jgi:hypothetical protein
LAAETGFHERIVEAPNRIFHVKMIRFGNGIFLSVTEGADNLGALVVSLDAEAGPVTSTIIPPRGQSFFLKLVAERISTYTKGITIASSSIQEEMDMATSRILMSEIVGMVQDE